MYNDKQMLREIFHHEIGLVAATLRTNGVPAGNSSRGDTLSVVIDTGNENAGYKLAHALNETARHNGFQTSRRGYACSDISGINAPTRNIHDVQREGSGRVTVYFEKHPGKTVSDAANLLMSAETVSLIKSHLDFTRPTRGMRTYHELGQHVIR